MARLNSRRKRRDRQNEYKALYAPYFVCEANLNEYTMAELVTAYKTLEPDAKIKRFRTKLAGLNKIDFRRSVLR